MKTSTYLGREKLTKHTSIAGAPPFGQTNWVTTAPTSVAVIWRADFGSALPFLLGATFWDRFGLTRPPLNQTLFETFIIKILLFYLQAG